MGSQVAVDQGQSVTWTLSLATGGSVAPRGANSLLWACWGPPVKIPIQEPDRMGQEEREIIS